MSQEPPSQHDSPVGLAHDYLLVMRGAERTFASIASCWPGAPIYTLLLDAAETASHFAGREIRTSYLQRLHVRQNGFRRLLPLFPRAVERIRLDDHDLIVSSSSAFAHGIRPSDSTIHICYCHSPFRYVWSQREMAVNGLPRSARPAMNLLLDHIRNWDLRASQRVTHYIANSGFTQRQIGDYYGREASVVHPPVEVERFRPGTPGDAFLVVSAVVTHKNVELALDAARRAGKRITVAGSGPDLPRLKAKYGDTADFLGRVSDQQLVDLYAHARALIVPTVEEFGIAIVEAQASGTPVVAVDAGGAQETITPGVTGVLVPSGDPDALAEVLRHTDFDAFDAATLTRHAARFAPENFQESLLSELARLTGDRALQSHAGARSGGPA